MTSPRQNPAAPIGVFDSGLGGLTVARRLWESLPHERIVFLADQTHVPYGGRELAQVRSFAIGISASLLDLGCKAVVMACNISSATALAAVQTDHPERPVLGVIAPGARAAAQTTRTGKIGVLATAGTVRTGAYARALNALDPNLQVTEVACPAFVPLVEAGKTESPEARTAACDYLAPLRAAQVDIVILGCTHYPFLLPALQSAGPEFAFLDPATQTVLELTEQFARQGLLAASPSPHPHRLYTTGDPAAFASQLALFLPESTPPTQIASAHWRNGCLAFDP